MKKEYIKPDLLQMAVATELPISASNSEYEPDEEYPGGSIPGGGGTGSGGITDAESRRRNNYSSRDDMVGGWRRGGLW